MPLFFWFRNSSGAISHFMLRKRSWLNGSYLEYCIVASFFIILTIIYTNFVILNINHQVFTTYPGDGTGGFMWYNFAQHSLDPFLHPTNIVNYPYGEAIGGPTFITYMALWLPLRVLSFFSGPIVGLNLFMLLGFLGSAISMYWLLKRLTGNVPVSLFSGFATAFFPYVIYKSVDHLPYILSYVFVFMIAGFIALWSKPTKLRAMLFGLSIALSFYTDGYYLLLGTVLVIGLCVAGAMFSLLVKMKWCDLRRRIGMLIFSALCLLVFISPILFVQFSQGSQIQQSLAGRRSDISSEMYLYRSNPIDFVIPAQTNPFLKSNSEFQAIQNIKNKRSNPFESTNYIGFVLLILSSVGLALFVVLVIFKKFSSLNKLDDAERKKFILIACISVLSIPLLLSFMLSPEVKVLGYSIPLPGKFFIDHNIALWRVMSRFFVPLHVVIVILSSLTLWVLLKTTRINRLKIAPRRVIITLIVGILATALAAEYATTVNRPSYDFSNIDKGYTWLKQQTELKVIAELPIVDPLDHRTADYVTSQIIHGKKIVNSKESTDTSLTDILGGITNHETIDWAYQRGAQAIITHYQGCSEVSWGTVIFSDDKDINTAMCIYRLDRPISMDAAFIKFESGFLHRPNTDNQDVVIFNSWKAILDVTNDRFSFPSKFGIGRIETTLSGPGDRLIDGNWSILQNGRVVGSGDIKSASTNISVDIEEKFSVEMQINLLDTKSCSFNEFSLNGTKATDL